MYTYRRIIFLKETDATGALHFSSLLEFATEAFQKYLHLKKYNLQEMLHKQTFGLPVVHVQADFFFPLFVGDEIEILLSLEKIQTSSFILSTSILKAKKEVGKVHMTHVCIKGASKTSIPLPSFLTTHLREL